MTIPDELVQAAAEALFGTKDWTGRQLATVSLALQAAFAKLPECPHVLNSVRQEWALAYKESGAKQLNDEQFMAAFGAIDAALAREFGGQE